MSFLLPTIRITATKIVESKLICQGKKQPLESSKRPEDSYRQITIIPQPWWFQPIRNICLSIWIISPKDRGEHFNKQTIKPPPGLCIFLGGHFPYNHLTCFWWPPTASWKVGEDEIKFAEEHEVEKTPRGPSFWSKSHSSFNITNQLLLPSDTRAPQLVIKSKQFMTWVSMNLCNSCNSPTPIGTKCLDISLTILYL